MTETVPGLFSPSRGQSSKQKSGASVPAGGGELMHSKYTLEIHTKYTQSHIPLEIHTKYPLNIQNPCTLAILKQNMHSIRTIHIPLEKLTEYALNTQSTHWSRYSLNTHSLHTGLDTVCVYLAVQGISPPLLFNPFSHEYGTQWWSVLNIEIHFLTHFIRSVERQK